MAGTAPVCARRPWAAERPAEEQLQQCVMRLVKVEDGEPAAAKARRTSGVRGSSRAKATSSTAARNSAGLHAPSGIGRDRVRSTWPSKSRSA